jgi:hypothetical protein
MDEVPKDKPVLGQLVDSILSNNFKPAMGSKSAFKKEEEGKSASPADKNKEPLIDPKKN